MTVWRAANADKLKAYDALKYAANPAKENARCAKYRDENRDKINAYSKEYAKKNPESRRIWEHNRNARKRSSGGVLSKDLSEKLFTLQKGRCVCCRKPLGEKYHLDHIMPLCLGGANEDWNIQLLCPACNHKKHRKHPVDFMQVKGFLL